MSRRLPGTGAQPAAPLAHPGLAAYVERWRALAHSDTAARSR